MRSYAFRRWGPIVLAIAMSVLAPPALAAITPESDVVLPWFEVDLEGHDDGLATTFSVVNASPNPVRTRFTVYTNWGIPMLEVLLDFDRTEAKTIDLHAWLADGKLPGRVLGSAQLAHIQAALAGKKSPIDGFYYGSPFQEGLAVGYVIVQTLDDRPDVLWGDTYSVDTRNNHFGAETLSALTHTLEADCRRHGIRFVNEESLHEGAELIIWSGRRFEPSLTPNPVGDKMKITIHIYDQTGHLVNECQRELIAVEPLACCNLERLPAIGWFDIVTDDPTFILEHLHSVTRASAELHSYCLREDLKLVGPSISIRKTVQEHDANSPPGPKVDVGEQVDFAYHVTNTGTVALTAVSVTDDTGIEVTCPKATLDPGETMVCTARTTADGCVNRNVGTATGTAPAGERVSASDLAFYNGMYAPALTLELLVNGDEADHPTGPHVEVGETLHWTFVVSNSGNARLSNLSVALKNGEAATCPKTELDPGETMTCTAESLAARGQQHEIGTASGADPCNVGVVETDPAFYLGLPKEPAIEIEKYVGESEADTPPGPTLPVGTSVVWQYKVTNVGNVPLTGIVVTDVGLAVTCPKTALEPGESMLCSASSAVLPCQQSNTARATGTATLSERTQEVSDTDTAHYFGEGHPALTLELKVNGDPADEPPGAWFDADTILSFQYEATNSGDVALTNVVLSDDHGRTPTCPKTALEPGESMTCTASGLAVVGTHDIMGSASGGPPCGPSVQATDPAYYRVRGPAEPSIDLVKLTNDIHADTAPGPSVAVGSTVVWKYVVTNTGQVQLTDISVTDSGGVTVACPKITLDPSESMTCIASDVAQACQYSNTATAQGRATVGGPVSDSDIGFYFGQHQAAITIDKRLNGQDAPEPGPSIRTGTTLSWTFVVTNTGDIALTNISVTDDRATSVTCPKTTLVPLEMMTCTASGTALAGQQRNIATATGTPPCGQTVTATDASYYRGITPSIRLKKLINGQDADDSAHAVEILVGAQALWSFVVTNTGDVPLSDIAITDSMLPGVTCPLTTLDPGSSMTCTASSLAASGTNCNLARAVGTWAPGSQVESEDPACYHGYVLGTQGCTPGYWKNHTDSWPPAGYSPSQTVVSVFAQAGLYPALGSSTLLASLGFGGGPGVEGAAEILLRAATAALLNAAHPGVAYPRMTSAVIADVDTALASQNRDAMLALAAALDADNNRGCPLN